MWSKPGRRGANPTHTARLVRRSLLAFADRDCYRRRQVKWTPAELAKGCGGRLLRSGPQEICGAFIDSRTPIRGGLFVPIVAARDGHDFISNAIAGGAAAVLVARGRPAPDADITVVEVDDTLVAMTALARARRSAFEGPVVSISGSNGKTTTRAMISAVLGSAFDSVLCTQGNLNNHLGVPLTLLGEPHEPDAMVLELGMSAPGENDHLASIVRPRAHVITSVALEHLEFMKTIEAIAEAEAEPVRHVAADGVVVVPSDEPRLGPFLGSAAVAMAGPGDRSVVEVVGVKVGSPTIATLRERGGAPFEVRLQLFGEHNARNAAFALTVGRHFGLAIGPMVKALEAVQPVGDRGRVHALGPHLLIADCYNSNPGSVEVALRSLAALRGARGGPLIAVLGDMLELGPTENQLHADAGTLASTLGLSAVLGFGPRSRHTTDAATIDAEHAEEIEPLADAVRRRLAAAEPGAVLVKGSRGMKLERLVSALLER